MFCCLKYNVIDVFPCGSCFCCCYCYCCHCIVIITLIQSYCHVIVGAGILIMRIHTKKVKTVNIIRLGWCFFILVTILKVISHTSYSFEAFWCFLDSACWCNKCLGWSVRLLTASFPNLWVAFLLPIAGNNLKLSHLNPFSKTL